METWPITNEACSILMTEPNTPPKSTVTSDGSCTAAEARPQPRAVTVTSDPPVALPSIGATLAQGASYRKEKAVVTATFVPTFTLRDTGSLRALATTGAVICKTRNPSRSSALRSVPASCPIMTAPPTASSAQLLLAPHSTEGKLLMYIMIGVVATLSRETDLGLKNSNVGEVEEMYWKGTSRLLLDAFKWIKRVADESTSPSGFVPIRNWTSCSVQTVDAHEDGMKGVMPINVAFAMLLEAVTTDPDTNVSFTPTGKAAITTLITF
mmetsp:Transcript_48722/g.99499  ORF Transcript_48722/g.99499 Transcript_48722/m.99499 type:complete len:267 (-) Transcript_48722:7122-7922(-)